MQNDVPGLLTLLNTNTEVASGSVADEITDYSSAQDGGTGDTQDMVNRYYNVSTLQVFAVNTCIWYFSFFIHSQNSSIGMGLRVVSCICQEGEERLTGFLFYLNFLLTLLYWLLRVSVTPT